MAAIDLPVVVAGIEEFYRSVYACPLLGPIFRGINMVVLRGHVSYFVHNITLWEQPMSDHQLKYLTKVHRPIIARKGATRVHFDAMMHYLREALLASGAEPLQLDQVERKLAPFRAVFPPEQQAPAPSDLSAHHHAHEPDISAAALAELPGTPPAAAFQQPPTAARGPAAAQPCSRASSFSSSSTATTTTTTTTAASSHAQLRLRPRSATGNHPMASGARGPNQPPSAAATAAAARATTPARSPSVLLQASMCPSAAPVEPGDGGPTPGCLAWLLHPWRTRERAGARQRAGHTARASKTSMT